MASHGRQHLLSLFFFWFSLHLKSQPSGILPSQIDLSINVNTSRFIDWKGRIPFESKVVMAMVVLRPPQEVVMVVSSQIITLFFLLLVCCNARIHPRRSRL